MPDYKICVSTWNELRKRYDYSYLDEVYDLTDKQDAISCLRDTWRHLVDGSNVRLVQVGQEVFEPEDNNTVRYFVCLSNSYKRGGRCIAGIEVMSDAVGTWTIVHNSDGSPRWIRPIHSHTPFGEIPDSMASDIKLFSIVKLTDVVKCPQGGHAENVFFSRMEVGKDIFPSDIDALNLLVDPIHRLIFDNRGKAVSSQMFAELNYSLMLIHPHDVCAFIDESRVKSKNRMKFTYDRYEYDLPITDPSFLTEFRKAPNRFFSIPDVYLAISLGLEFEGWHHKLIAGVLIPNGSNLNNWPNHDEQEDVQDDIIPNNWFGAYEQELLHLLEQKADIEGRISELRSRLLAQMERLHVDRIDSTRFTVNYTPAKTVMQFDNRAFREEYEDLYARFCKAKKRDASIVVKRKNDRTNMW